MNNRAIKFRVWDKAEREFADLSEYDSKYWLDRFRDANIPESLILQQFTGLKDKNGIEAYDGDIIQFRYKVGDFAWEFMTDEEEKQQEDMLGKLFIGVIVPELLGTCNLEIVCGSVGGIQMFFPLAYIPQSEVIGNIFENGDLLKCGQALKDTKGHGDPVNYHNQTGEILAIGFFGFVRYLEENGLKFC